MRSILQQNEFSKMLLYQRSTSDISPTTGPSRVTPPTQPLLSESSQIGSIGGCRVLGGSVLLSPREPYREDRSDRLVPATEPCRLEQGQWASTDTATRVDQRVGALILEYKVILQKTPARDGQSLLFDSLFLSAQKSGIIEHVTLSNGGIIVDSTHFFKPNGFAFVWTAV